MNEIKWYWFVIAAFVILYLIARQKNITVQQEIQCAFGFCGTLTSGDSFNSCITTISPGITEGNLSHACAPIGAPTMVHCNHIIARRCGIPTSLPPAVHAPSLPVFHQPAALAPPAPTTRVVSYSCAVAHPCLTFINQPKTATAPAKLTYYCGFVGVFRTIGRPS